MSLDKIYVLKKILKEALQIQEWQLDIFTSLHNIDASWIVSGTINLDRIPNIDWGRISDNFPRSIDDVISSAFSRNWISDFFSSPFWSKIPDKPSTFPPSAHTHGRDDISDFFSSPFWSKIPDKPDKFPPEAHSHLRDEISDFFNSPFWDKIPDKPSVFPPEAHSHDASDITSGVFDAARIPDLDASKITSGVLDLARIPTMDNAHIPSLETLTYDLPTFLNKPPFSIDITNKIIKRATGWLLDISTALSGVIPAAHIPDLDASKITTGVFDLARIPDLVRSKISDLFSSPFWSNIPDKPFDTLGSEFTVSSGELQIASILRSKISDFFSSPFWDNIPDKPFSSLGSEFTVSEGELQIGSLLRSKISDFFSSPFWSKIPDKPSTFPPSSHTHTISDITDIGDASVSYANSAGDADTVDGKHASDFALASHTHSRSEVTDFWGSPFWNNIPDIPTLKIGDGSSTKITYDIGDVLNIVAGSHISVSYDDTNNKITISVSGIISDTYKVKADSSDSSPGYLSAKVDGSTIVEDSNNHYIKVGSVPWSSITNKPSCYTPCSHTHTRSDITDFFDSPFWDNIPDKPSEFPPESHTHDYTDITLPTGTWSGLDADKLDGYDASAFAMASHAHSRSDISDFFNSPFWDNIPDKPFTTLGSEFTTSDGELQISSIDWSKVANKPSTYPPESHTHTRSDITDFWSEPFWDNIPDKPDTFPPSAHTHDAGDITSGTLSSSRIPWGSVNSDLVPSLNDVYDLGDAYNKWRYLYVHYIVGNLIPSTEDTYNIGDSTYRWKDIYFSGTLHGGSADASIITSGTFNPDRIPWGSVNGDLVPSADNTYYLGTYSKRWNTLCTNFLHTNYVESNLIPSADNEALLGSSTYRWKDLYVVTVHQGDAVFSNGWRISEGEKYGVDSPLVLVSPDGEVYKFNIEKVGR